MKIKFLIKVINVVKLVWNSKKCKESIINVEKDFSKSEVEKKALAIGRWVLFKEMYYGELIHTGLFNTDVEHILFQYILKDMRVKSNVSGVDMTGDEMLELYSNMMKACQEAIDTNTKITDKYPLPKLNEDY